MQPWESAEDYETPHSQYRHLVQATYDETAPFRVQYDVTYWRHSVKDMKMIGTPSNHPSRSERAFSWRVPRIQYWDTRYRDGLMPHGGCSSMREFRSCLSGVKHTLEEVVTTCTTVPRAKKRMGPRSVVSPGGPVVCDTCGEVPPSHTRL